MSEEQVKEYLTPREAAPLLNRTDDTVRGWCDRGVFQGVIKQGEGWLKKPRYLIPASEVERVAQLMGLGGKNSGLAVTA